MRNTVFWTVTALALAWHAFSLANVYLTLSRNAAWLADVPPEMMAMLEAFPQWRILLWVVTVFLGAFGAVALLLRRAMAERIFWATAALMAVGLAYDLAIADGVRVYGGGGMAFSIALIGIEMGFALYARWAARQGMLR